ncbi:hypothetical protein M3Y99_01374300 [Aphelenchoides fujianensis]|nr:hypothetical protein M3Y99_01374300 [Aphelenchoides fujianensis]
MGRLLLAALYATVSLSAVALAALLIVTPLLLRDIDRIIVEWDQDFENVRNLSNELWDDLQRMGTKIRVPRDRLRRQYEDYNSNANGQAAYEANPYSSQTNAYDSYAPPPPVSAPTYGYGLAKLKCCCAMTNIDYEGEHRKLPVSYKCPVGQKGPPGVTGEPGEAGQPGTPGFDGEDYPTLAPPSRAQFVQDDPYGGGVVEEKPEVCACPAGPQGPAGPKGKPGISGPKGERGIQGQHGVRTSFFLNLLIASDPWDSRTSRAAGKRSLPTTFAQPLRLQGDVGVRGKSGRSGVPGPRGADAQGGGKGVPGRKGQKGSTGVPGPRGVSGPSGDFGRDGIRGRPGVRGVKGQRGLDGVDGVQGPPGAPGSDAGYCKCPDRVRDVQVANSYGSPGGVYSQSSTSTNFGRSPSNGRPASPPAIAPTESVRASIRTAEHKRLQAGGSVGNSRGMEHRYGVVNEVNYAGQPQSQGQRPGTRREHHSPPQQGYQTGQQYPPQRSALNYGPNQAAYSSDQQHSVVYPAHSYNGGGQQGGAYSSEETPTVIQDWNENVRRRQRLILAERQRRQRYFGRS